MFLCTFAIVKFTFSKICIIQASGLLQMCFEMLASAWFKIQKLES
jgi:hypothetical protein